MKVFLAQKGSLTDHAITKLRTLGVEVVQVADLDSLKPLEDDPHKEICAKVYEFLMKGAEEMPSKQRLRALYGFYAEQYFKPKA